MWLNLYNSKSSGDGPDSEVGRTYAALHWLSYDSLQSPDKSTTDEMVTVTTQRPHMKTR